MAAKSTKRRIAEHSITADDDTLERVEPRLETSATGRDSGHYEDIEGHRRLMYSLGADFNLADPLLRSAEQSAADAAAGRWRLSSTFVLVVSFNIAAWSAIVGTVYALV